MSSIEKLRLVKRRLFRRWDGERVLKASYRDAYGKDLNYEHPRTFTEKMFHRLISMNRAGTTIFTQFADKYRVRDYVSRKVGEKHLVKLLWHGTDPHKIPFDALPAKYIIKTNHGCGGHVLVSGAVDRRSVIAHFDELLKKNYYWCAREFQYYDIKPRVLIEECIDDGEQQGPLDFRFWCFHGKPEIVNVTNRPSSFIAFFDVHWNKLDLAHYIGGARDVDVAKPANLGECLSVATALSEDFDFVRVDLYSARGQVYFGELTFTPRAGQFKFEPEVWDEILGAKW